jgi:hypothetical protein
MCGWDIKDGEQIFGIVLRLLASKNSNFSVDKVMADFYNSPYFALKVKVKRVGF